jgi:E3 ubiquitin-protein ligase HUWE1
VIKDDGSEADLIKNGAQTKVTNENKHEYVNKVAKYYLFQEVKKEIKAFLKGFH